jgi:hypothetical protein
LLIGQHPILHSTVMSYTIRYQSYDGLRYI